MIDTLRWTVKFRRMVLVRRKSLRSMALRLATGFAVERLGAARPAQSFKSERSTPENVHRRIVWPIKRFAITPGEYCRRMSPNPVSSAEHPGSAHEAACRLIALVHAIEGCSRALRGAIEQLAARRELTTTQLTVLWACGSAADGVGQSRLAAQIGVSPAQASALVEQLRSRGLLEPRRATDDRRRQHWSLTVKGRELVASAADDLGRLAHRLDFGIGECRTRELTASLAEFASTVEGSPRSDGDAFPRLHAACDPATNVAVPGTRVPSRSSSEEVGR